MKQVNFSHPGGFPLEQETLERLQTAYRYELFEALKGHLSIKIGKNYTVAPATNDKKGWAIIHQEEKDPKDETGAKILQGILYPIEKGTPTGFLKTTRTGTNLTYGTGVLQTAYFDYEAQYISSDEFANRPIPSPITDALAVYYYELKDFKTVKDIEAIETIIKGIETNIDTIEANIDAVEANIGKIETDINLINQSYLPLNGSKAMQGDLDLSSYKLSKLDIKEGGFATVRVADLRLGSINRRGLLHPTEPTGKALVDNSTQTSTNLTLNYGSDWQNTSIGGKVYLENLNTSDSIKSLLVIDNANQVTKNNTLIDSLINRIIKLEEQPATAVPIGMIAIWGKTAPFPKGWEEYVPLRGRVPVGLDLFDTILNKIGNYGGSKDAVVVEHSHDCNGFSTPNTGINGLETGSYKWGLISPTTTVGESGINKNMQPYRVVHFIEYTGSTVVTNPTDLEVSKITDTTATLTWKAATDNVTVANYLVSVNGALPFSVGNVLSYNVTGLSAVTPYSFYVIAQDAAGKQLGVSNTVYVTTTVKDTIKPTAPTNLRCYPTENRFITLEWDASTDNVGVVRYRVYRKVAGGNYEINYGTPDTYATVSGDANTTYYFMVTAFDAAGNESEGSNVATGATDPSSGSCFDVESLVTMASGQSKKLKNIVVGDKLQGLTFPNEIDESEGDYMLWNGKLDEGTKAEVTVVAKRTSTQPNYYEIKTADATIKVTGEHPLLISQDGENVQYVCTKNVEQSMLLIDKAGKTKAIESILFKEEPLEVALLDVEDVDNYVISGIVVHNSKPIDKKDPNAPGN
ncbi:fibronectin type III domain-containing protein [Flavobacterium sp. LS1R49]|uniref:Fibronectin type III domain-containing protein n=1 Tax=Flavobacterium shii TaxID=2987687 RepID=A0A9X2ZB58_9FLAO|nr:fibronectin type III domain-containing protein [Flavobacterium shii]MCV9926347.1 fibronectin type III domain-containing protein [Flavobacterium shii]